MSNEQAITATIVATFQCGPKHCDYPDGACPHLTPQFVGGGVKDLCKLLQSQVELYEGRPMRLPACLAGKFEL